MEHRSSKRKKIAFSVDAKLISGNKSYNGFIENVSEQGIKWYQYDGFVDDLSTDNLSIKTAPSKGTVDFEPGKQIELELILPSGEKLALYCIIKWATKSLHPESSNSQETVTSEKQITLGMEILNPPLPFKEFYKSLE